jgi:hypothetical protein
VKTVRHLRRSPDDAMFRAFGIHANKHGVEMVRSSVTSTHTNLGPNPCIPGLITNWWLVEFRLRNLAVEQIKHDLMNTGKRKGKKKARNRGHRVLMVQVYMYMWAGLAGTTQAHKSTAYKGMAHKSTYLIMGCDVPARMTSHRPTARPTISYVSQAGPNSPKCLNVPDQLIYIQQ